VLSVALPVEETGEEPRPVLPSTKVTMPAFTVSPELSVTETFAVRVTLAVVPEAMEAGLGDPLTDVAVGCALVCVVKFRHQGPWSDPRLPPEVIPLTRYKLQVPLTPPPPNSVVKVAEPVGAAVANVDGAGDGNVSEWSPPRSMRLSVGKHVVHAGAMLYGISDVPVSAIVREPLVKGFPAQERNWNALPELVNGVVVEPGACSRKPRSTSCWPLCRLKLFRLTVTLSMVPLSVGSVSPGMFVGPRTISDG